MEQQATKTLSPNVIKWEESKKTSNKEKKADELSKDDISEKSEEEKVEPNKDFLKQLEDMGFAEDLSKQALIKVKNESITAAVEVVVALTD
mmetsp:Transcript_19576/g.30141  ORF Transcript_19576/g.30141 Transcript_19576/m.30141 type:complete len:91 (+) Transcript_19576:2528-2800(+)